MSYQAGSPEAPAIAQAIRAIGEQPGVTLVGDAQARYARNTFDQEAAGPATGAGKGAQPAAGIPDQEREKAPKAPVLPEAEAVSSAGAAKPKPERQLTEDEERDLRDKRGDGTVAYKGGFLMGDFIATIHKNHAAQQLEKVSPGAAAGNERSQEERSVVLSASGEDRMQVLREAGQRLEARGLRIGQVDGTDAATATMTARYRLDQPTLPYVHQGVLDEQATGKVQVQQAPGVEAEREREARRTGMEQFQRLTPDGPALTAEGLANPAPAFVAANQLRADYKLPSVQQDAERQLHERASVKEQAGGDPAREAAATTAYVEREALLRQAQLDSIYAPTSPARARAVEALAEMTQNSPLNAAPGIAREQQTEPALRAPVPSRDTDLTPVLESPYRYVQVGAAGEQAAERILSARQAFEQAGASVSPAAELFGGTQLVVGYHLRQPELAAIDQKIREAATDGLQVSQRPHMDFERQEQIGRQRAEHGPGGPTPPAERVAEAQPEKQPEQRPVPSAALTPELPVAPEPKAPRTVLEIEEGQRAADQKAVLDAGSSQLAIVKVVEPATRESGQGLAEKIHNTIEATGALVGDVKSTVVGTNRHSEMPVSYRTDSEQIKEVSNVLERATHTPGVTVEERDEHKSQRLGAVENLNKSQRELERPARTVSKEIGD